MNADRFANTKVYPSPIFTADTRSSMANMLKSMVDRKDPSEAKDFVERTFREIRELDTDAEYILDRPMMERVKSQLSNTLYSGFATLKANFDRDYTTATNDGGILPNQNNPILGAIYEAMVLSYSRKNKLMGMDHIVSSSTLQTIRKNMADRLERLHDQTELVAFASDPANYVDGGTLWALLECGILGGVDKRSFEIHFEYAKQLMINIAKYVEGLNRGEMPDDITINNLLSNEAPILTKVYLAGNYDASPVAGKADVLLKKLIDRMASDDLSVWAMAQQHIYNLNVFYNQYIQKTMSKDMKSRHGIGVYERQQEMDEAIFKPLELACVRLVEVISDAANIYGAAIAYSQILRYLGPDIDLFVFKRLTETSRPESPYAKKLEALKGRRNPNYLTVKGVMEWAEKHRQNSQGDASENLSDGLNSFVAGNNDINFQGSALLNQIANVIAPMLEKNSITAKALNSTSGLVEIIQRYTGLTVKFEVDKGPFPNAAVLPAQINPNHVYDQDMIRKYKYDYLLGGNSKKNAAAREERNGVREGEVNLATGKVSGLYSKLVSPVWISEAAAWNNFKFTAHEVAAIIIHELGHIFYCFYKVNQIVQDGTVLTRILKEVSSIKDSRKRKDIIVSDLKKVAVEVADPQYLETLDYTGKEEELIGAIYMDSKIKNRPELSDTEYANRLNEQLADHFSIMHGGGAHLATAMEKSHRSAGSKEFARPVDFYFGQITLILMMIAFLPLGILVMLLVTFLPADRDTYDDLPKRFANMRRALINEIKVHRENPKMIEALRSDVETIEAIERSLTERKGFLDWWSSTFNMPTRRLDKQIRKHTAIEELVSNSLFLESVKIKQE